MWSACRTTPGQICKERKIRITTCLFVTCASLLIVGCGSKPKPEPDLPSSGTTRRIGAALPGKASKKKIYESSEAEFEARRDDGSQAWSLNVEYSRVGISEDGTREVFVEGVQGKLFDEVGEASRFKSQSAKVNASSKRLVAEDAEVDSNRQNIKLTANIVRWDEEKKIIIAEGDVWLTGEKWNLGPSPVLYATPDLTKVGTPDKF